MADENQGTTGNEGAADADQDFDTAWNQAGEDGTAPHGAAADTGKTGTADGKTADSDDANTGTDTGTQTGDNATDTGKTGTAAKTDTSGQAATGDAGKTGNDVDWKQRFEELEQRTRSWEGRLSASDRRNKELNDQLTELQKSKTDNGNDNTDTTKTDTGKQGLDLDNDPDLKKAAEEYPEVFNPLLKTIKALNGQIQELSKSTGSVDVKPINDKLEKMERDAHFSRVAEKHPDYLDIGASQEFKDWLNAQPSYVRPGLERVVQNGSTEEVVDLLTDYKTQRAAKAEADEATRKAAEIANKRTQQQTDAGAVRSRGGGPAKGEPDPSDFDTAWNEAPD